MLVTMDFVWIVLGTVAFWKLVGRPVAHWLESVVGLRVVRRVDAPPSRPRDDDA